MRGPFLDLRRTRRGAWKRPSLLTRKRVFHVVSLLLPILVFALLIAARPSVEADATCNVPPVNLTSALGDDNASVVLNWEASGECVPDEYAVYRRDMDVEGSRMTRIAGVDGDVLTYTDTTVNSGEVYRYRIRSNNIGRRSDVTEITIPEASVTEADQDPAQPTTRDTDAPTLSVATVNGTSLVLTYNETLDADSTPVDASAYSVTVAGTSAAPSSVAISDSSVTLTLATAVSAVPDRHRELHGPDRDGGHTGPGRVRQRRCCTERRAGVQPAQSTGLVDHE